MSAQGEARADKSTKTLFFVYIHVQAEFLHLKKNRSLELASRFSRKFLGEKIFFDSGRHACAVSGLAIDLARLLQPQN